MADDPNRDILPVREGSCADTCRSSIDPRERHFVYKLDRYQLEDKYLRLLEEASNLKKLSNCQEDKIKRLATKLMRVTANPRACTVAFDVYEDKNKIIALELENSKLKDKISVLRNQLLSHTIAGRSSSRSRNPQARPSSGRITCRSENSRTKIPSCHCIVETVNDDYEAQSKVEELEEQKKEMSCRIAQLEKELSAYTATTQREKVAENVEYIRCWRQMKQLNDKLKAARNTNESLNMQINDLKRMLEEATKNNQEITTTLLTEKKHSSQLEEEMLKAKDSQLSLREKDEQIKDLVNEMKILQQHNSELMALSSKNGDVELENLELKRKVNEQRHDQEALKAAFNTEQANIVTLQTSNEQLLGKLHELQKNMDSLTVQLTSFQAQTEKQEAPRTMEISEKQPDKKIVTTSDRQQLEPIVSETILCRKCCNEPKVYVTRGLQATKPIDKFVQTEYAVEQVTVDKKNQGTSTMTPVKEKPKEQPLVVQQKTERTTTTESSLTPEKMLKLLEQAQINTPLDGMRFAHKDVASNVGYNDILDLNQRHSDAGTLARAPQESPEFQLGFQQQRLDKHASTPGQPLPDTNKMLSFLFNVLQEYSISGVMPEAASLYRPTTIENQLVKDINNNVDGTSHGSEKNFNVALKDVAHHPLEIDALNRTGKGLRATTSLVRTGCDAKKFCTNISNRLHQEKMKRKMFSNGGWHNRVTKFPQTVDCTCNDAMRCNFGSDCDSRCCNNTKSLVSVSGRNLPCGLQSTTIKNAPTNVQKALGTMYITRKLQDENDAGPYRSWKRNNRLFPETKSESDDDRSLKEYMKQLNKCRELLGNDYSLNGGTDISMKMPKAESFCTVNCPNECVDAFSSASDSFPLVIADGQGLMELHVLSLQLSTSAKQILFRESNLDNVSLFVSWDLWDQETAYTPTLKCPKLNFNSSFVYRITDLHSFFTYVLQEFVMFQVNVYHEGDDSYVVAAGKLCIKDILDYPQNKLHYIAPVNSVIPCSLGTTFGQLSLWVRLSCDIEKVETFKRKRHLLTQSEYRQDDGEQRRPSKVESPGKRDTVAENDLYVLKEGDAKIHLGYESPKEHLPDSDSHSPVPFETSESPANGESHTIIAEDPLTIMKETDMELRLSVHRQETSKEKETVENDISDHRLEKKAQSDEPTDDAKGETDDQADSSSVAEFNAIIVNNIRDSLMKANSNESFDEVTKVLSQKNWEKYKRKSMLTFSATFGPGNKDTENNDSSETLNDDPTEKDTITIEILNIILFPKSSLVENEDLQLLYVEFSFLGYTGPDMETVSVKKPKPPEQKMTYNFKKKFCVDEESHTVQDNILRAMLNESTNPNITFLVVCEPLPEETDTKECVEVGYAELNLREYALGDSSKIVTLPIYNADGNEKIGLLKISVMGLDTIRQRLGKRQSSL